ncbi:MAG: hypothetical protein KGQ79_11210 [Proteobacteria bacterium]|nr:hypothetical protein [Pseudomonadota bacterium]
MRFQTTPSLSPNGLGNGAVVARDAHPYQHLSVPAPRGAEPSRDREAKEDHHDDGLVHGHFWAMSSTVR